MNKNYIFICPWNTLLLTNRPCDRSPLTNAFESNPQISYVL